jgi:hypothetical protein
MSAGATASGTRAFVANRHFAWLTPRRLRALTIVLLGAATLASATLVSGSTPPPSRPAAATHQAAR